MSIIPNLISIIMPVYNRFDLVERSIKSVLEQSYDNWELIIIDDASEEPFVLPDIVKNNEKVKLIRNIANVGPGCSRQRGVDSSRGELITFLDSDDFYETNFLQRNVTCHNENAQIGASYCISIYFNSDRIVKRSNQNYTLIFPTILNGRPWHTSSVVYKKACIGNWTSLYSHEDYCFDFIASTINNTMLFISEELVYVDDENDERLSDENNTLAETIARSFLYRLIIKNFNKFSENEIDIFKAKKRLRELVFKNCIKLLNDNTRIDLLRLNLQYLGSSFEIGHNKFFYRIAYCSRFFSKRVARRIFKYAFDLKS